MAAIAFDKTLIRPLLGAITAPQKKAGAELENGEVVIVASDGDFELAGSTGAQHGVVIANSNKTAVANVGDDVVIVTIGPVTGYSGMTPGALVYAGANGIPQDSGTVRIGFSYDATTIYFLTPIKFIAS